jgi:polyhydroxybutyrate depolymerase
MLTTLLLSLLTFLPLAGQPTDLAAPAPKAAATPPTSKHLDWTLEGVKREAIIYFPASATVAPTPVVFAFHGHGGTARNAANTFEYQKHWPEAISVYMQGLPTPGALTDPDGKKNGWQKTIGDQSDRDLKFFDAVLATLRKDYKIDDARIYCTGHSNGGGFTYLLWSARGDTFAAVAPSSAGPGGVREALALKPKPCMHIAGEKDMLVKFVNQQRTMERVKKVNGCTDEPKQWGGSANALEYPSKSGTPPTPPTPFISVIHPGGHEFYSAALPLIVKFFKEHAKAAKATESKPGDPAKPVPRPVAPAAPAAIP